MRKHLLTEWAGDGRMADSFGIGSLLTARIEVPRSELRKIELAGVGLSRSPVGNPFEGRAFPLLEEGAVVLYAQRHNAFTNLGIHAVLDNIFAINTPSALSHMGITDDDQAVTAATLLLDPATGGANKNIRTLGTGVNATATSRTGNTVTATAGWQKTVDFAGGWWPIKKVGMLNTSTDAGDDTVPGVLGVWQIIGGTGGASPYNEPFTIDLSSTSEAKLTLAIEVTPTAT